MEVYSICPQDQGSQPPSNSFQGCRDKPITSQPEYETGNEFPVAEPDQPVDSSSFIHAIQYLKSVDKIFIQQNIALLEVVLGVEARNKYQVLNPLGQKVFLALEESGFCSLLCCGPRRSFQMHLYDNLNNEVIRMHRHWTCWMEKLEVYCPADVLVGFVQQEFKLLHPTFSICDRDGMTVLQVKGPICQFKCCKDVEYKITNSNGEVIGSVSKQWMGFLQEGFTDADSFRLVFPLDLDVNMKMVLLGAAFLIDYMFFEQKKSILDWL